MSTTECPRFLAEYPRHVATHSADKAAFIFEGETLNYGAFAAHAARIGVELRRRGVLPGDRIAYLGRNSADLMCVMFGILNARAIFVPINWRLSAQEMLEILADSKVAFVFVTNEFLTALEPGLKGLFEKQRLCVVDAKTGGLADWLLSPIPDAPPTDLQDDDVVLQLYTSGTTGKPKGVLITNRNMKAQRDSEAIALRDVLWRLSDVIIASAPMFNIGGLNWCLMGLPYGATYVILQAFRSLELLETIDRHRVTQLFAIPAIIGELSALQAQRRFDVSSLRAIHYGSAPIAPIRLAEAMGQFDCAFVQHYGSTEGGGSKFILPPNDHRLGDTGRLESCGKAMPGVETRVTNNDGDVLPVGAEGELQLRSISIARNYWRSGAVTPVLDSEGWLATGDVGRMDVDGYFQVMARKNDIIISGGSNIYPVDVENVIQKLPGIRECAVFGVPDPRWGEAVKAVVVVEEGVQFDPEAMRDALRDVLAGYKIPKTFDLAPQLPRTAIGKIDRVALREPYWKDSNRRVN